MTDDTIPTPPQNQPRWADDELARMEVRNWTNETELRGQKNKNKLWALKAIGIVTFILIIFFSFVFMASLFAWVSHYIRHEDHIWLNSDQLSKIESIIFSGSLGAIVASYVQKHLQ